MDNNEKSIDANDLYDLIQERKKNGNISWWKRWETRIKVIGGVITMLWIFYQFYLSQVDKRLLQQKEKTIDSLKKELYNQNAIKNIVPKNKH